MSELECQMKLQNEYRPSEAAARGTTEAHEELTEDEIAAVNEQLEILDWSIIKRLAEAKPHSKKAKNSLLKGVFVTKFNPKVLMANIREQEESLEYTIVQSEEEEEDKDDESYSAIIQVQISKKLLYSKKDEDEFEENDYKFRLKFKRLVNFAETDEDSYAFCLIRLKPTDAGG